MIFDTVSKKIKVLRKIKLSKEEEHQMCADFSRITGIKLKPIVSEYFVFSWQKYASYATLVVLLSVSTLSYAAEGSLPGDFLYPIKTKVNESVIRGVASYGGTENGKDAEVAILERRLDEAKKLRDKGELKDGLRTLVRENVYKQLSVVSPDILEEINHKNTSRNAKKTAKLKVATEPTIMLMSASLSTATDTEDVSKNDAEEHVEDNDRDEVYQEKVEETRKEESKDGEELNQDDIKEIHDKVKDVVDKHKDILDEIDNLDVRVDLGL